jgi:peptidoglycan hydrolase-like protein with peptidoglycan-binding domain
MRTWRSAVLGAVFATAIATGALWLVAWQPVPAAVTVDEPQKYPIEEAPFIDSHPVELSVQPATSREILAPVSGTVTAARCTVGATLASGDVVAEVDQRPILAVVTAAPLFRDLAGGETGADVVAVQLMLRQAGFDVPGSGQFDWATRDAVSAFLRAHGVEQGDGVWGALRRTSYVWAPEGAAVVDGCPLHIGDRVSEGTPLITLASQSGRVEYAPPAGMVSGPRVLVVGGVRVHTTGSPVTDAAAVEAIMDTPEGAAASRTAEKKLSASIELAQPLQVFEVPPSALFDVTGSSACVADGSERYRVSIISSSLGMTYVTFVGLAPKVVDAFANQAASCG